MYVMLNHAYNYVTYFIIATYEPARWVIIYAGRHLQSIMFMLNILSLSRQVNIQTLVKLFRQFSQYNVNIIIVLSPSFFPMLLFNNLHLGGCVKSTIWN